jgi:Type II secretion system (T2SS), protein M subtype b
MTSSDMCDYWQRLWSGSRLQWVYLFAGVGAAFALCAAATWHVVEQSGAYTRVDTLQRKSPSGTLALAAVEPTDFTFYLRSPIPPAHLADLVSGAAARNGVVVSIMQINEVAAAHDRLGRSEIALAFQGSYPAVKQTLAELQDRWPSATVARLQWRRADNAEQTEARVQLVVWSRPRSVGAVSSTR